MFFEIINFYKNCEKIEIKRDDKKTLDEYLKEIRWQPSIRVVPPFYDDKNYIYKDKNNKNENKTLSDENLFL